MYAEGKGVTLNYKMAKEWLTKAANQGYANAQLGLGTMYLNGIGVTKDNLKAIEYLTKAANQGYGPAYRNLAIIYDQGKGVTKDIQKYEEYLKQGCLHKDEESCEAYAEEQELKQSH